MRKALPLLILLLSVTFILLSCKKEYSLERTTGALLGIAEGTLKDTQDNCLPVVVSGKYYVDKSPNPDSNYITIQVNVTRPGTYNIVTDNQNGFMFSNSGVFADTGLQAVVLKLSGKPLTDTITGFSLFFDNTICTFSVNVENSADEHANNLKLNTWEFTDSTNGSYHSGVVIRNPPSTNIHANGQCLYTLIGATKTNLPYDSVLYIVINFPVPFIETGTFPTNNHSFLAYANEIDHASYYLSNDYTGGKLVINVTSYDDQAKIIKGNFRGPAVDQNGNEVFITSGRFYANVY